MVELTSAPTVEPEALPGRAFPRLPDEANPQAFGSSTGRGIEQAADILQQTHNRVQAQARQTMVTDAHNKTQALSLKLAVDPDTGFMAKQGQNAFGLDQQYLPQFDQGVQQIAAGIPDPRAKQLYLQGVAPQVRNHLSEQIDTHEIGQHKAYESHTIQSGIELAGAQAAANYNHPDILSANKDHVNFLIDQMAKNQGWSTETTEENRQKAISEFHGNIIDSMMMQGQVKQAQTYLFQASAAGEVQPKAAATLQRVIQAKQAHDLAMADKIQRDASNVAIKNLVLMNQQGQLTPQAIEKYHSILEPAAYEMSYNMLHGKGEANDPNIFSNLLLRGARGEDVRDEAQRAFTQDHTLNQEGFIKIVGNVDTQRPGWYKLGVENISSSIKPGELNPDPNVSRSRELALQDWNNYAASHPDIKPKEAQDYANTLVDHYLIVPQGSTVLQLRAPPHLLGTRDFPIDESGNPDPMLKATTRRMAADLQAGKMTQEEAQEEARLIMQYRQINQRQIDMAAKKQTK